MQNDQSKNGQPVSVGSTGGSASDMGRMNWLEQNYTFPATDSGRFSFHPPRETWHATVKSKFPRGFWSRNFGPKDDTNRWGTLREAIDAAMRGPNGAYQPAGGAATSTTK